LAKVWWLPFLGGHGVLTHSDGTKYGQLDASTEHRALSVFTAFVGSKWIMAKFLKRGRAQLRHDWSNNGSFISRPVNGWLHPDEQLSPNAGICYGVRVRW